MPPTRKNPAPSEAPLMTSNFPRLLWIGVAAYALGGCAAIERLTNIGQAPALFAIENPASQPGYKPVQMPMPAAQPASYNPNSLWRNGSRALFSRARARAEDEIL